MDGEPRSGLRRRGPARGWRHQPPYLPRGGPLTDIRADWEDGHIVVRGPGLPVTLAVSPVSALRLRDELVPTAGSWARMEDEARFTFRFEPVPGTEFAVLALTVDGHREWQELARVRVPRADVVPRTIVETIDPSVDSVPANLLRFSVTFSSPMEEGSAAGSIHLMDEHGGEMTGTLLEMPPELWDRDRRRLTVLLEPGRIKRGLQPHVLAGPPLREGTTVTLVVDAAIRDAAGSGLAAGARRAFRVGPPIRARVDPTAWAVTWPSERGEALLVRFDRPLDRALVKRYLQPIDADGKRLAGHASLDAAAVEWVFTPAADHDVRIRVDPRLEDLAGNSVRRVFDRDLRRSEDDSIDETEVIISRDR